MNNLNPVHKEVDRLYKELFGKLVASLLYSSRDLHLETAEDIVQDSFSAAIKDWERNGMPLNPAGWLYKVCKNNALNKIRKDKRRGEIAENLSVDAVEIKFAESVLNDRQAGFQRSKCWFFQ